MQFFILRNLSRHVKYNNKLNDSLLVNNDQRKERTLFLNISNYTRTLLELFVQYEKMQMLPHNVGLVVLQVA